MHRSESLKYFAAFTGSCQITDLLERPPNAINVLMAEAEFGPGRKKLNLRVGVVYDDDGDGCTHYYDLTNPEWEAVRISADDWNIDMDPPIIFKKYTN